MKGAAVCRTSLSHILAWGWAGASYRCNFGDGLPRTAAGLLVVVAGLGLAGWLRFLLFPLRLVVRSPDRCNLKSCVLGFDIRLFILIWVFSSHVLWVTCRWSSDVFPTCYYVSFLVFSYLVLLFLFGSARVSSGDYAYTVLIWTSNWPGIFWWVCIPLVISYA